VSRIGFASGLDPFVFGKPFTPKGTYMMVAEEVARMYIATVFPSFDCGENRFADFLQVRFRVRAVWLQLCKESIELKDRRQRMN
jgi:hypothetical protein